MDNRNRRSALVHEIERLKKVIEEKDGIIRSLNEQRNASKQAEKQPKQRAGRVEIEEA